MKKWKEAASVIIAASTSPFGNVSAFSGLDKDYKELPKEKPDFQILALKKSSESPLLAGRYVFPGGTANVADSSDEWIQLFKKFGYCVDSLCKSLNNSNTKLPIFDDNFNKLPRCISLRITAIREAFEESGILLCKTAIPNKVILPNLNPVKTEHLIIEEIDSWRKKVMKNPREFFNLCLHNDCYPDISALYLWSNWLTPSNMPVRFDSVFFTAFLGNPSHATQDNYEIESLKWVTAPELLLEFYTGKSSLHFPQLYEVSRLARFSSFCTLAQFAVKINGGESDVWMPVRLYGKDGEMNILPGDELYPKHLGFITPYFIIDENRTLDSFNCHQMHRMIVYESKPDLIKIVITNLEDSSLKHVLPWTPDSPEDLRGHL